ncbi:MAG: twin arginine targeting protein translocase subunit TatC, partial [Planctomycetota bacterium]|nr:twin arginine targeting protein translocase subunit TatC [Planctomycetota bacterium]
MPPTDKDLFAEEQTMRAMSFGDHIEELRTHLILALAGLFVGVTLAFIPPLDLGRWVMRRMQDPATVALKRFYEDSAEKRSKAADATKQQTEPMDFEIQGKTLYAAVHQLFPEMKSPSVSVLEASIPLKMRMKESDVIKTVARSVEPKSALISLAPLETFMIYFSVCMVTGLIIASPWVFYQIWAFIAAGLYRHERHYVKKFIPFSLFLFLGGVFLCFFWVLPYTLEFLLNFNVWLGIEPTLRISEWISFATILPLVFGVCFQTPLVMMLLARVGVVSVADFRAKRKFAILIIVVIAAVITPTGDPFTLALLALP